MPASTFQSESFQKMLVIGVQAKDLHLLFIKNYYKVMEKNSERGYCIPLFRKTKRIMKITTLFSLGNCMLYFCLYLCAELQGVDQQAEQQYY